MPSALRALRGRIRDGHYAYLEPRHLRRHVALYARDRVGRRRYRELSEEELRATRSSDTAFVFGSGRSLVEITAPEWEAISRFNTISLREFPRQRWIRADYHLTGEVDHVDEYAQRIRENPLYANTVFVVHGGFRAEAGNELIGRELLPEGARVFRFRRTSRSAYAPPSGSPRVLVHGWNSIFDATNLAVALGYRRIVLAGADYYNKEYFWLPEGETRPYEKPGIEAATLFTGYEKIIAMLGDWSDLLAAEGIELSVFNPRSLLSERLPIFDRAELR
jgi:hypothetical protein